MIPRMALIFDRKGQATGKKAGVVELRISHKKVKKYISTGVWVYPNEWSNGSVVGRKDWKEINNQLQIILKRCSDIITKMMEEGNLDLNAIPSMLKDGMIQQQTFIDYAKELAERKYRKVAEGTKKHYECFFRFLDSWKGIVYFSDVTERNILKMDDELVRKGLQGSSRWNFHKKLKTFIIQAVEDGLVKKNPYARLDIKDVEDKGLTKYLTPQEFKSFANCVIPVEHLRKVRDLFVFQTYTMMSYSDLAAFSYEKCIKENGQVIYKSKRQKTKQEFIVVLLPPALAILKRYKNKLPIISNAVYNKFLKEAVEYAKITKPVSTHWARHTGATLLLNEGKIPMHIVQHILGHASIRETEKTYAKVLDRSVVDEMVNYHKKKAI